MILSRLISRTQDSVDGAGSLDVGQRHTHLWSDERLHYPRDNGQQLPGSRRAPHWGTSPAVRGDAAVQCCGLLRSPRHRGDGPLPAQQTPDPAARGESLFVTVVCRCISDEPLPLFTYPTPFWFLLYCLRQYNSLLQILFYHNTTILQF